MNLISLALAAVLLAGLLTPPAAGAQPGPRATAALHPASASAAAVRIDPAYWWVGMKNPKLQLLVHAPGVGASTPGLKYAGVTLDGTQKLENPNYLLVNLTISPQARPGQLKLVFEGPQSFTSTYELRARNQDPGRTQGLTQADFIYLLMPDRFANGDPKNDVVPGTRVKHVARDSMYARHGGDLRGIQNHFAYLKQLGVTAIWPTPLIENDMPRASYHGYAVTDGYRTDPRYGSNEEYQQFVQAAHAQGLKVVQDIVLNHWGSYHYLFLDKPAADWFHAFPRFTRSNYNAYALNDPHGAALDRKLYNDGWFDTTMPDVNQRNPAVATYLIQNFLWWVESSGLDGYRIDTYPYSDPQFLMAWGRAIADEYPKLTLFGEAWESTAAEQAFFAQNILPPVDGFKSNLPGVLDFQITFAIGDALKGDNGGDLSKLYQALQADWLYVDATRNVTFLDNHDMSRFYSVIGEDFAKYKMGLAWLLTLRGIPSLYYGTEVLMKNFSNPDGKVREDFPGGFAGDKTNYFIARPGPAGAAFEYVSKLANYRRTHPVLSAGKLMQFIPQDGVYTYFRYNDQGACVMVIANVGQREKQVDGTRFLERTAGFSSGVEVVSGAAVPDLKTLRVPARTAWVVELKR